MLSSRSRLVRFAVVGALVLFAVVAYLLLSESLRQRRLVRGYQPPGEMVSIGTHRLHLYCTGNGTPVVLLEAGSGLAYSNWQTVQSELSPRTRVCSYDRTGLGWSEPGAPAPSANQATTELHRLLQASGMGGSFIFVGHSLGGLYAQQFLNRYPESVAAVVLVDAPHPDVYSRPGMVDSLGMDPGFLESLSPILTHFGLHRRSLPDVPESDPSWVPRQLHATSKHLKRAAKEWWSIPNSADQVRDSAVAWGDTPLVVLQAGNVEWPDTWSAAERSDAEVWRTRLQTELARRSSRGEHRVLAGVGHGIPWEAPGVIVAVVDSLNQELR
jgi:pimeloyl-ACP methyl ester carboxylesterase